MADETNYSVGGRLAAWSLLFIAFLFVVSEAGAQPSTAADTLYGNRVIRAYFDHQVRQIESTWLEEIDDLEDWKAALPERRRKLREMLGLDPLPERTELQVTVTGTVKHPGFTVKKLHFQSMPGLYVTANLYIPDDADEPLPGVLYVAGHANRYEDDVPLGAKAAYQRHPGWYARHGYVALVIDTVQRGEILGVHHGTYRRGRWWWWNRGYTPLGVETWNSIRALDYLESLPEVDPEQLAVTGRSGGGIYSWTVAALDDRIKTTVPTAGIADLRSFVVDEGVSNHCDCMFMTNTYRWDYPMLSSLVAPRPVLLANGDHDPLFPLDGVMRLFNKTRQVYGLYEHLDNWDHLIVDAPHDDIPPLRQGTYQWMHRELKGEQLARTDTAVSLFDPVDLKVFDELPEDEINTKIDELFVALPSAPSVPESRAQWEELRSTWRQKLNDKTFGGWPETPAPLRTERAYSTSLGELQLTAYDFKSQEAMPLRLWVLQADGDRRPDAINLSVVGEEGWQTWLSVLQAGAGRDEAEKLVGPGAESTPWPQESAEAFDALHSRLQESNQALVVVAPRGIGPTTWYQRDPGFAVRRSFMLLGQTRDGMRVWDVRRAVQLLGEVSGWDDAPIRLGGKGVMAGIGLYAAMFEPDVDELDLQGLPSTHRDGPILLNVRKVFDMPQAVALAAGADRRIRLQGADAENWQWPLQLTENMYSGEQALQLTSGSACDGSDVLLQCL